MKLGQILAYAILLLSHSAQAFTLNNSVGASFPQKVVKVNVAAHTCVNLGISNQALLDMTAEAVNQYWNTAPASRLQLEPGSLVSVSDSFRTDNGCQSATGSCNPNPNLVVASEILISCNIDSAAVKNFSNGVLAVTIPNNISGSNIKGALILVNDTASNGFRSKAHDEQVAILAHEIGHGIGLGHSPVIDSLMYYSSIPTRRSLGEDDMDGIHFLYPTEQPIKGCGTIADISNMSGPGSFFLSFILGLLLCAILLSRPWAKRNRN